MEPNTSRDVPAFKLAFRRHAAGVAVVTARTPSGDPAGFTATSLASLSADPPLATVNLARTSSSWRAIEGTTHVLVHLLGARNSSLAGRLSGAREERFAGDHWSPGPLGLPLLRDVPAWMLGRIVERVPVAGSAIVVLQIEDGGLGDADDPLLYYERAYVSLDPTTRT